MRPLLYTLLSIINIFVNKTNVFLAPSKILFHLNWHLGDVPCYDLQIATAHVPCASVCDCSSLSWVIPWTSPFSKAKGQCLAHQGPNMQDPASLLWPAHFQDQLLIVLAFCHCDKIPEKSAWRREDLFWLRVSVHSHLALSLWSFHKVEHDDGEHVVDRAVHFIAAGKQRKGGQKQCILFKVVPTVTYFL